MQDDFVAKAELEHAAAILRLELAAKIAAARTEIYKSLILAAMGLQTLIIVGAVVVLTWSAK